MKSNITIFAAACLAMTLSLSSCEGEKDLVIIDGNLPIKTTTLYMVGDATPNGWNIDAPTPLVAEGEDPLVFTWEGTLNPGEIKLCLTTGSWDAPFIRPLSNGEEIGRTSISGAAFQMHAGDPDEKWRVTEAGTYLLTFDLRGWTMSTSYSGGAPIPDKEPIETDALYMVGDATPGGWNIDAPTPLEKMSDYVFEYEGPLTAGELKACTTAGSWDVKFMRPASDGTVIDKSGITDGEFVYTASPDHKWRVTDPGIYNLSFNLKDYTITARFLEETVIDKTPIESETLYMIGDATPGGWSMDEPTAFARDNDNRYLFSWQGELVEGNMKACLQPDPTFSCPFLRPSVPGVEISEAGVAADDFVYTTNPDDQWRVTRAGEYIITFDLEHYTIDVKYLSGGDTPDNPDAPTPLESETLYMIGDATPGGWSMDEPTAFTRDDNDKYRFTWEGNLTTGEMKACLQPDPTFSCPFLRPATDGCAIDADGAEAPGFIYTTGPDYKWKVVKTGRYRIIFNLKDYTIEATSLD